MASQVCAGPTEINNLNAQILQECVHAELQNTLDKPSFTPPAVPAMTNFLLERVCSFIWGLSDLREWNKQRLLARVVAALCGGRFPTVADAERPGQRMHEFILRYRDRHKKSLAAERAAMKRAQLANRDFATCHSNASQMKVEMEEALFHCRFGCTPASLPKRVTPPGLRPQSVEYVCSTFAREHTELTKENGVLKQLETEAINMLEGKLALTKKDLSNAVVSEHKALLHADRQASHVENLRAECECMSAQLKELRNDKKRLRSEVKLKEGELTVLGGKVGFAHFELTKERDHFHKQRQKLISTFVDF